MTTPPREARERAGARKARRLENARFQAEAAACGDGAKSTAKAPSCPAEPPKTQGAVRRPKKVPKAKLRKRLIAALDKEFSLAIRALWPFCFWPPCGKPTQDCFHIFTRSKKSIRWDARNAVGSCKGHNMIYEQDQAFIDDVRLWYVARNGQEAWDTLKFDGNQIAGHSNDDLEKMLSEIRAKAAR